LTRKSNLISGY